MSRILILSGAHLCRNPRVLKAAATLAAAGHEVTLLHVALRADFDAEDRRLMAHQRFRRETLDLSDRLSPRGLLSRLRTRLARAAPRRLARPSLSALGPAQALLARTDAIPSDLLIAHSELPLCLLPELHRRGRRVAADLEDWYSEDLLPDARRDRPLHLLQEAERFALRYARFSSTTSHALARALHARYGGETPIIIRNSFPLQSASRVNQPVAPGPRLLWFSQTIGPGRGLEEFIPTWSRLRGSSTLTLLGHLRSGYRATLDTLVVPERRQAFHVQPPVSPDQLPTLLAGFDVGLALEPRTPANKDLTISNKILQYLNAGLAVIATPTAGQREVFAQAPGAGILLPDSPESALPLLQDFLSSPEKLRAAQLAARAAAEREFCWEKEAPRLIATVEAALPVQNTRA